jgi:hypothetical protein
METTGIDKNLLQRLLVCRETRQISPTLVDEVLKALPFGMSVTERRAARDTLIREAARLLPGRPWQRAEALTQLIRRVHHPVDEIRRLLWQASRTGVPMPASVRHVHRIIVDR